jgi:hypothetical protein
LKSGKYNDFTELKKAIWEDDKDFCESIGVKNERRNQAMEGIVIWYKFQFQSYPWKRLQSKKTW